jgi:hypothetical protein
MDGAAAGGPTILQFFPIWTKTPWLEHPHQAGQEQRIQFVGAQHPHLVCMMVMILLNSIVDITSWTGKKKRTTSNLLSSHCPSKTGSMENTGPLA